MSLHFFSYRGQRCFLIPHRHCFVMGNLTDNFFIVLIGQRSGCVAIFKFLNVGLKWNRVKTVITSRYRYMISLSLDSLSSIFSQLAVALFARTILFFLLRMKMEQNQNAVDNVLADICRGQFLP